MKRSWMFLPALLFAACMTGVPPEIPYTMPRLVEQAPMPPLPATWAVSRFDMRLNLQIGEDGSVLKALMLNSSGSVEWDSLALARVRLWKYIPATSNHRPIRLWITQVATIQYEDTLMEVLARIECDSLSSADSAYLELAGGARFSEVFRKYSADGRQGEQGVLGNVEIHRFPYEVQKELKRLEVNEFTKPLLLGKRYVIFKRLASSDKLDS